MLLNKHLERDNRRKAFSNETNNKEYSTRYSILMVTHPDINAVQQGLISVNRREPVVSFGDSRTPTFRLNSAQLNPKWQQTII